MILDYKKLYYLCEKKSRPDGIFSIYINDKL